MARAKLSADDQAKLVALYRESDVTATALAEHFGVSNSTVSRILREAIPAPEYRRLSRLKRSSVAATPPLFEDVTDTPSRWEPDPAPVESAPENAVEPIVNSEDLVAESLLEPNLESTAAEPPIEPAIEAEASLLEPEAVPALTPAPLRPKPVKRVIATAVEDEVADADTDEDEVPAFPLGLDFSPEADEDDEDEDDSDSDGSEEDTLPEEPVSVEVQAFEGFEYPDLGYTLIDKYQELVTSPLSAFVDQVPPELANVITLPVFDTHRGARRYSHQVRGKQNKYRVLTFPGTYLEITRTYLQAKGITHVIMNHQVYEL